MTKRGKFKSLVTILLFLFLFFGLSDVSHSSSQSSRELDFLNEEIESKKKEMERIQEQRSKYSERIEELQEERDSLQNQLDLLDSRLARTELEIKNTENQISRVSLETRRTNFEIREKEDEIERKKDHISNIINLIYKQNKADTLEILLLNDSFSDFINQLKYLQDINEEIEIGVRDLENYREELQEKRASLVEKNKELVELEEELNAQKEELIASQERRKFLLEETSNSEEEYQDLLEKAKQQRQQVSNEIASLESAIRAKLEEESEGGLDFGDQEFIWPVPSRHITAGYHDPNYPFRHLFEHPGIDIRAAQGTTIRASASGYVGQVRFNPNSSNYAYIMLIHGDGLATVYGHISQPLVEADQYVTQGQEIALSGGTPGTAGSGHLSTGPHLHFEIRKDGIPVNPMNYLP